MEYKLSRLNPFGVVLEPTSKHTSVKSLDIEALRSHFREYHFVVLRGFDTFQTAAEFADYCESWGEISIWPFGKVLELIEQDNPADHIFDNSYVPLHWDGMYRPQVPEYQIFHCVKAPLAGQGGRTTFANTISALKNASPRNRELWSKVVGTYERKMEFYNSRTVSPVVDLHPRRGYAVIRYNEPPTEQLGNFVNPPRLEFSGVGPEELGVFHDTLKQALYAPENFYAHEWRSGDIVIADNFSLLHGREGFTSKSPRHLQRVQVLSDPPFDNPRLESFK